MNTHPTSKRAFTLVEMLVVIAVITIISAITIPAAIRSGLFSSRTTDIAGREMFETLRAAKIYAGTNNVETAVVYAGKIVVDSHNGNDVPIIDAIAIVRRMSQAELTAEGFGLTNDPIFRPLRASEGMGFEVLRDNNCILADIFEVDDNVAPANSVTGLSAIQVWDSANTEFFEPRADYSVNASGARSFPAHRFLPSGALEPEPTTQRMFIRIGLLPNQDVDDRYPQDPNVINVADDRETIDIWFDDVAPVTADFIHHPDRDEADIFPEHAALPDPNAFDMPLETDIELFIYTATGRVKVGQ